MPTPYLGGYEFTAVEWIGSNAVELTFRADDWSGKLFQCYRNRTLAAVTAVTTERTLTVSLEGIATAAPLWLVVVDPADRLTDYGHLAGWKAWNQYCLAWQAPATIGDLDHFDVCLSTAVGEAYDASNVVGRVDYDANISTYHFSLPGFEESGDWEAAVIPRDDAIPSGNAGTESTVTIPAVVLPLDVALQTDGSRGTASVSSGTLTIDFAYP